MKRKNYKQEKNESRRKDGARSNVVAPFTDPNFFRKETGIWDVPGLLQSNSTMVNSADVALIVEPVLPVDEFNSFMVEVARFYQSIRRNNSANAAYTMADLAAYLLNVRSVRNALTQVTRIMRLSNNVDSLDTSVPVTTLSAAAGFTAACSTLYPEVMANSAALYDSVAKINRLAETSLPVGDFAAFRMDEWMLSNVWRDSPSPKYATIQVSMDSCRCDEWTANGNVVTRTGVKSIAVSNASPITTFVKGLATRVALLSANYTNALIAGDIQHAMGSLSYHPIIGADKMREQIEPIYDPDRFLRMFKNSSVLWSSSALSSPAMSCDFDAGTMAVGGTLTTNNVANHSIFVAEERYIDAPVGKTGAGDVATSLYLSAYGTITNSTYKVEGSAGWLPMDIIDYHQAANNPSNVQVATMASYVDGAASTIQSTAMSNLQATAGLWSMIDWMPMLCMQYDSNFQFFWDMDYFARVTQRNLDTYFSMLITALYDTAANAVR